MRRQQIGWKGERDSAREQGKEREREREREREKNKSRSQNLKSAGVNVASLASRISCSHRRPLAPSNTGH